MVSADSKVETRAGESPNLAAAPRMTDTYRQLRREINKLAHAKDAQTALQEVTLLAAQWLNIITDPLERDKHTTLIGRRIVQAYASATRGASRS